MASIPGGSADKLGNEFERLWTVRHLIHVLAGNVISVQIEALGHDERGTEFWVSLPNGIRQAHQAKRENGSHGDWSAADLNAKGVLKHAKFQLDRDPKHEFIFVSGDKAPSLADLNERAMRGDSDEDFYAIATATTAKLKSELDAVARYLELDPNDLQKRALIRKFLRRFHVRVVDKLALRGEVEDLTGRWVSGDPATVVSVLESFISRNENMGRSLRQGDVIAALPAGSTHMDLRKDPSLSKRLDDLNGRFDRSYRHLLIGGQPLGRPEAAALEAKLLGENPTRLLLLHGAGGDGKSGVAFELTTQLSRLGIPYLALRLDRDKPADSPTQFGRSLDLPASPVACLAAAADGRPAVMILDQIDAIRWTAAHSSHAWDTCERMIAEALRDPNVRVLVVCRSFDAEDDPRIRKWKQGEHVEAMKIGPVDDATVKAAVGRMDIAPEKLGENQRSVLRSPQALYLLQELYERHGGLPAFRTMTDLMKLFWKMVRQKLKELKPGDYEKVLDALVQYMDSHGTVYSPASVVSDWPEEDKALASLNIISVEGSRILFAHQSYLDHLTAERVLREIYSNRKTVSAWLKDDEQSLLRRGQVRQLLTLLRDEDPKLYSDSLLDLLTAPGVRFHLQYLALVLLSNASPPTSQEVEIVIGLLDEDRWIDHVLGRVVIGKPEWFDALHTAGVLTSWFNGDERRVNMAVNLLAGSVQYRPEVVDSLLGGRKGAIWLQRLAAVLGRAKVDQLPERLFQRYLQLVRRRSPAISIDWKHLAKASPSRCVCLLRARALGQLRQFGAILEGQEQPEAHDLRSKEIIVSLRKAAEAVPIEAWDHLMPCLLRVGQMRSSTNRVLRSGNYSHSLFEARRQLRRLKAVLCRVLKSAGISMAKTDPESLWSRVRALDSKKFTSSAVNWVIAHSIAAGPDAKADEAMNWLLSDQRRLRCGPRRRNGHFGGGVYRPARRLLRRYGLVCSEHHFKAIEDGIRSYRPDNELRDFKIRHETFMGRSPFGAHGKGHLYPRLLFLGQHLLLSALPDRRLDLALRDWRGLLRRKFGEVKALIHEPRSGGGGFVTSTIPKDRLHLIPNRQWLEIVSRDWTPYRHRHRQISANTLARVGPETFAKDLALMCLRQPQRFTELARRMPVNIDNHYLISMLHALTEAKPPENTPEAPRWQPASCQQIEAVFEHFSIRLEERECASGFCRIIQQRPEGPWSRGTLHRLADLAIHHPHPAAGEYTAFRGGGLKHSEREADIVSTALNCVRGQAAGAIAGILYCKLDEASFFNDAISALLADKNIAVRAAAIGLAVPMLNDDRAAAVDVFLRACDCPQDDILEIHHVDQFLSYTILDYLDRLLPLLHRMLQSPLDEIATKGSGWITVVWVNTGKLDDLKNVCLTGRVAHRKGVVQTLVNEMIQGRGNDAAAKLLGHLFDDADDEVRQLAASAFHNSEILRGQRGIQLANAFANSRAVSDKFDFFFMGLKTISDSLVPYADAILPALDHLVPSDTKDLSDLRWRVLGNEQMVEVLLRLYEQSDHDRHLRKRCLDLFDRLLAQQIGSKMIEQLDT